MTLRIQDSPASMDFDDIKKILLKKYERSYGGTGDRNLIVSKSKDSVGSKIIFFFLQGSPPKGYALWIEGHRTLTFYDPRGQPFKIHYLQYGLSKKKKEWEA